MISDESSSDSETGRFKGKSEKTDQQSRSTTQRDSHRSTGRDRHSENDRFRRDIDRKWDDKDRSDRLPRERLRYSRHSPIRRRRSAERSPNRKKSHERHRRTSRERSKVKDYRSNSRDRRRKSRSRSHKPAEHRRDIREEIKCVPREEKTNLLSTKLKSSDKFDRGSRDKRSSSLEVNVKKSEIYKPAPTENRRKSKSPIVVQEKDSDGNVSEEVQPGSYYSMMPTVVKEKSEESSEIDSSDDEKLRAKLLNLEKELHQAKKKKHKKKHRKKGKSSKDDKDIETPTPVEVTSTTDIQDKIKIGDSSTHVDTAEVTSTQKNSQIESNEEGEIISDDESQTGLDIDPSDLRHKLKRSVPKAEAVESMDLREKVKFKSDVCGPALPPHLAKQTNKRRSAETEGPALPPHLRKSERKIGPSIPDQLRIELAKDNCEIIKCESSDDDGIGPLPVGAEEKWSDAHRQLEERALDMKIRTMDGRSMHTSKVKSREEWMLELPEAKAKYLGLEARSFRAKEGPDMSDRSSWTETPEQKARKRAGLEKEEDLDVVLQQESRTRQIASRDEDQERAVR
ncbi:uncharacterized protein [Choristoneura fumiferana]|uniref:uncharacterized protein n=1 Tax=Choristoneura fumiferana TaxID=7141 RepID=UPI003D156710